mgnify:CR=1 FL=1
MGKPAAAFFEAAVRRLGVAKAGVLMIGDGLNDAPSLAAAHCSLSPITAVDLAQAQSDAVFLGEKLQPVVDAIDTARKARGLMLRLSLVQFMLVSVPRITSSHKRSAG